jgi:hypothetical protein
MNEKEIEEQVTTCPTSTTTTTANSTINSTSITSMRPTTSTITTTIDLTGNTPITATTIVTTGVTTINTNTTPFISIDTDTEEECTKEPNSKHQKTDHPGDTGSASETKQFYVAPLNICLYISLYIYTYINFRAILFLCIL